MENLYLYTIAWLKAFFRLFHLTQTLYGSEQLGKITKMWVTEALADYISNIRPKDLTPVAKEMARRCILDLVGAAAAGLETAAARAMRNVVPRIFARGAASVWFSDSRLQGPPAAME